MRLARRVLCLLGLRRFCAVRPDRSHDEMEAVRQRQREIAARMAAIGVAVDVPTRAGESRGGNGAVSH